MTINQPIKCSNQYKIEGYAPASGDITHHEYFYTHQKMSQTETSIKLQAEALVNLSKAIADLIETGSKNIAALDAAKVQITELVATDGNNAAAVEAITQSLNELAQKALAATPAPEPTPTV